MSWLVGCGNATNVKWSVTQRSHSYQHITTLMLLLMLMLPVIVMMAISIPTIKVSSSNGHPTAQHQRYVDDCGEKTLTNERTITMTGTIIMPSNYSECIGMI
jgi:heme/copper-type cytochrome/quinol oxidase subunit 2